VVVCSQAIVLGGRVCHTGLSGSIIVSLNSLEDSAGAKLLEVARDIFPQQTTSGQ